MKSQELLKLCIEYCYTLSQDDEGTTDYLRDVLDVSEEELLELFKELNRTHKLGLITKEGNYWTQKPLV